MSYLKKPKHPINNELNIAPLILEFISQLRLVQGRWAGQPFVLEPWQCEIVTEIFGRMLPNGSRQYRTAYLEVPRKNGKSHLAAAIALYMLFADGEYGAEIYSAASDQEQASLVFNVAAQMVRMEPGLNARCRIVDTQKRIIVPSTFSFYHALSSEVYTKHGLSPSAVIFDELHTQPNRELWDVLTTGSGTREQPLVLAISTAGYDQNSICWEQHEYAKKVIEDPEMDPSFFGRIYTVPEKGDWKDKKNWYKANPALGTFRSLEEMEEKFRRALITPALENTFKRYYLDIWTEQADRWLPMDYWDKCKGSIKPEDLVGRDCYAALDLSSTTDTSSLVLDFSLGDGAHCWLPFFWLPADELKARSDRDRVPYATWARAGLLQLTPGNVIDYAFIKHKIMDLRDLYTIKELAYDRWGSAQLVQELQNEGLTITPFGQGYKDFSGPTKELLRLVLSGDLKHGGNPMLRWQATNLAVKTDPAENVKPDKPSSASRIDGIVAGIMALARAQAFDVGGMGRSVYEDRGVVTL